MSAELREALRGPMPTPQEFEDSIRREGVYHPLLVHLLEMRVNERTRRTWFSVLTTIQRGPLDRYVTHLLADGYCYLRLLHGRMYPTARASIPHTMGGMELPRRTMEQLRASGMTLPLMRDSRTIEQRANSGLRTIMNILTLVGAVLWFDNFYRRRYAANPAHRELSLNSTVLAALPTELLDRTVPSKLDFAGMVGRVHEVATRTMQGLAAAQEMLDLIQATQLSRADVRVPLDVPRVAVRSLPWTPLQVSGTCVSSTVGLLSFLFECLDLCGKTGVGVTPLLVDVNLHYRMLKLACGATYVRYDIPSLLESMPPLFGLWHLYKYCVDVVARRFHSLLWYCSDGDLPAGTTRPSNPRVRTYELIVAAILMAPRHLRVGYYDLLKKEEAALEKLEIAYQEWAVRTTMDQAPGSIHYHVVSI